VRYDWQTTSTRTASRSPPRPSHPADREARLTALRRTRTIAAPRRHSSGSSSRSRSAAGSTRSVGLRRSARLWLELAGAG
jgi:hypothetical protein